MISFGLSYMPVLGFLPPLIAWLITYAILAAVGIGISYLFRPKEP